MDTAPKKASDVWKDLQAVMKGELDSLDSDRQAFEREKEEWEAIRDKLATVHTAQAVKLNIGGKKFRTTLATLKREDSMLSRMFTGGFTLEVDEEGNFTKRW